MIYKKEVDAWMVTLRDESGHAFSCRPVHTYRRVFVCPLGDIEKMTNRGERIMTIEPFKARVVKE